MTVASIPTTNWPKQFLLQIHAEAVKHGFIWIEGISQANAESLRQRLYRVRRRSDKATASFIPPEYHLVGVGEWQPEGGGRLPVIFNRLPTGEELPTIRPATPEEVQAVTIPDAPQEHEEGPSPPAKPTPAFAPEDIQLKPADISDLVASMTAAARQKSQ
jgi:hypothetical protein